jgi:hypothetical protein
MTHDSPVPTQTMFGSLPATAIAPIAATGWSSKTGTKVAPLSVDFHEREKIRSVHEPPLRR